jgi:hypothetical protein
MEEEHISKLTAQAERAYIDGDYKRLNRLMAEIRKREIRRAFYNW